jgi:hypothetical protein
MMQPHLTPTDYDFPQTRYMECRRCHRSVKHEAIGAVAQEKRDQGIVVKGEYWGQYRCWDGHEDLVPLTHQDYEALRAGLAAEEERSHPAGGEHGA